MRFRVTKEGIVVYGEKGRRVLGPFKTEEEAVIKALHYDYFNGRWGDKARVTGDDPISAFEDGLNIPGVSDGGD